MRPKKNQAISGADNNILIGRLGRPFGVRGWLHLKSLTAEPADILHYRPWIISQSAESTQLDVRQCRVHGKGFVAQIGDVTDRDQAAALTGQSIYLPEDRLPRLPEGEYYLRDLLGAQVVTEAGVVLGKVLGLIETGASHDVLQVQNEDGGEHLIPWLKDQGVIKHVDLTAGCITLNWEPGDT